MLIGGERPHQGNVMVNYGGDFGAILSCEGDGWCQNGPDYSWSCSEAEVVCRQLGYIGAESYSVNHEYGIQDATFRWRNVFCQGDETSLLECSFEEHSGHVSDDGRVAGVSCLGEPMTTERTTIGTETTIGTTIGTTPEPSSCPHGWLDAGHIGCFFLQENLTVNSWYEANLICEDLGGFLVEPKTEEIQDLLSSLLLMLPGLSGELDWWIGLTDTGHEGSWLWVHEAEFAEEQFWAVPPDSSEGNHADCALLSRKHNYMWRDEECWGSQQQTRGVLCQH